MPLYIRGGVGPVRYSQRVTGKDVKSGCGGYVMGWVWAFVLALLAWPLWALHGTARVIVAVVWFCLVVVMVLALLASRQAKAEQARRQAKEQFRQAEEHRREAERTIVGRVSGYTVSDDGISFTVHDRKQPRHMDLTVPPRKALPELLALHDGAVVKATRSKDGSELHIEHIWNSDGTPGPGNSGEQEAIPYLTNAERSRQALKERQAAELEEAKHNGWLLLDDGMVNAYHGVTPSGITCHHRHRTPEAAIECAERLQRREERGESVGRRRPPS